jgi:hypothetical protein
MSWSDSGDRGGGREPMSSSGSVAGGAPRKRSASTRLIRAWRDLPQERRLAAMASLGLFLTLFLPWYQETVIAGGVSSLRSVSESLSGWAAFSFVEAAVLLVAAAVLLILFVRAEGAAFHVPGGDGGVITAAGVWTCVLIVWRIFDKEGTTGHGQFATTSGIEWGIFVALGIAAFLTYAGTRIRLAHEPEPPLPGERARASTQARSGGGFWRRRKGGDTGGQPRRRTRQSAPPAQRGPHMDVDDAWSDEPEPLVRPARPAPARPTPPRERRPSRGEEHSWQYDEPPLGEADTRVMPSPRAPVSDAKQPRQPAFEASQPRQPASAPTEATELRERATAPTEPRRTGSAPTQRQQPASAPREPATAPTEPLRTGSAPTQPTQPRRRVRPRSVGAPEPPRPQGEGAAGGGEPPGSGEPAGRAERSTGSRGLDRREIQDLDISEPPTARLGRAARKPARQPDPTADRRPPQPDPESQPEPDDAGDQLTIRLDRPN